MSSQDVDEWGRRRLLVVLGVMGACFVLLVGGLVFAVVQALDENEAVRATHPRVSDWPTQADGTRGSGYRDALAVQPMLQANQDDMKPAAPAAKPADVMVVESPTAVGAAGVPSGFSHRAEGAVAQLAAIEIAALEPMSIRNARTVHDAWAMEGAPFDSWELTESIRSFHQAAGTVDGDSAVSIAATPVGAQIKGADGPDWVLACVQLDVTVAVVQQTRFGYGHCERMQWTSDRWMIAPGKPPAQAPSTWPGSERSSDAGWLQWAEQDTHG